MEDVRPVDARLAARVAGRPFEGPNSTHGSHEDPRGLQLVGLPRPRVCSLRFGGGGSTAKWRRRDPAPASARDGASWASTAPAALTLPAGVSWGWGLWVWRIPTSIRTAVTLLALLALAAVPSRWVAAQCRHRPHDGGTVHSGPSLAGALAGPSGSLRGLRRGLVRRDVHPLADPMTGCVGRAASGCGGGCVRCRRGRHRHLSCLVDPSTAGRLRTDMAALVR